MRLPKAKDYPKVIYVEDEAYKILMVDRIPKGAPGEFGECNFDTKTIRIRKNQSPRGLLRTFIHEVLHAVAFEYGVSLKHKHINPLEVALEALLHDNF